MVPLFSACCPISPFSPYTYLLQKEHFQLPLGLALWWITLRRMALSELGEAATFLRMSEVELLLLQAKGFDGKIHGGC